MAFDPSLDAWRIPASDRCWWCGAPATTMEHRIKHSTLRRIARDKQGIVNPSNAFKKAGDYEGPLRSLKKGSQVKWYKNLCAACNNTRSQPYDIAYDQAEAFVVKHLDALAESRRLLWKDVFGPDWALGAANLGRYFAKQMGCMLAGQRLPIPADLIDFLNGSRYCRSVEFKVLKNKRDATLHTDMKRAKGVSAFTSMVEIPESLAYETNGQFSGVDYGHQIGFIMFSARWRAGADCVSWWYRPDVDVMEFNQ